MTKRITFKKFLAILLSVFMAFTFLTVCAQSVYANEEEDSTEADRRAEEEKERYETYYRMSQAVMQKMFLIDKFGSGEFDNNDHDFFYAAFTSDPADFPDIPLTESEFARPNYEHFFEIALRGSKTEDFDRIVSEFGDSSFGEAPSYFGKIYIALYNGRNHGSYSLNYEDVRPVVDIVFDTAYTQTMLDWQDFSETAMTLEEFREATEEQRARLADFAGQYLIEHAHEVPHFEYVMEMDRLYEELHDASAYGSIFSQGSSIAMLVVAIAEAAVIVVLLSKNKKLKNQPAAK